MSFGRLTRLLCIGLLIAPVFGAHAEVVTRGPYIQNVSTTAANLRWRTDVTSDSRVWLGSQPDNLALAGYAPANGKNHQVRLTGLTPGTRYYYAIGSTANQLSAGPDHFFETAPDTAKPTRIWVMGDSGTGLSSQLEVRNAYYNHVGDAQTDLILMLGDNAYERGNDVQYQLMLFDVYRDILRHTPLWPTLGNHDGFTASSSSGTGPYYDIFSLPKAAEAGGIASGTEAYYSFDFGNIHFVCLNSYDVSRAVDGAMANWLRNDLAANTRDWTIAYFHHPPYSKGSHNSDSETNLVEMRTNIVPILEQYGVDLVLAGHSHSYERSRLLNGHYDTSGTLTPEMILDGGSGRESDTGVYRKPGPGPVPNAGAVYAVVGVSGEFKGGLFNHPVMYVAEGRLASMVIDINGNRLDAIQLDNTGTQRDHFTIVKDGNQEPNNPPTVSITAPAEGATFDAPVDIAISSSSLDDDGTVARVDFYAGSTLLGTDSTEPFEHLWQSAPPGTHVLKAVARDDDGATGAAVPQTITVTGTLPSNTATLQYGTDGYTAMYDASLRSENSGKNFGNTVNLLADGSPDQSIVLRWDMPQIPTTATVTQAEIRLGVSDASNTAYNLYALKRPFVESKATWQRSDTGVNWQQAGANGADDRETTVLGSLAPSSTTGTKTVVLNEAGLAKLQSWIANPTTNYGFILLNYAPSNGIKIHSSEAATASVRPMLVVTYH
jgi:hypothetical protein